MDTLLQQFIAMTTSKAPLFEVSGRVVTEQQFMWVIGLLIIILFLFLIRNLIIWGTLTKASTQKAPPQVVETELAEKTEKRLETPKELLENTSVKKRTLSDFVVPDTINDEVAKRTLNNDYPYVTLKPDPLKMHISTGYSNATLTNIEFVNVPQAEAPIIQNTPTTVVSQPPINQQQVPIIVQDTQQTSPTQEIPANLPQVSAPPPQISTPPNTLQQNQTVIPTIGNEQQTTSHFNPADSLLP